MKLHLTSHLHDLSSKKLGLDFYLFIFFGHRPGGHMLNHFGLPCPSNCRIPLLRERLHTAISLSLSLSVHSTTCHELGVVGGHKKPEESNRRVCISSEIKFLLAL
jgi:hypothetical protein